MPQENEVSAVTYKIAVKSAARAYRKASARIIAGGGEGELYRAAALCPALCLRARSAYENIAAYKFLPSGGGERAEVFCLAAEFFESGEELSEAKIFAFLSSRGKKFGSITLSVLPDALFAEAFLRISQSVCESRAEGLSRLLRSAENLSFIDFSRVFLTFSVSAEVFADSLNSQAASPLSFAYLSAKALAVLRPDG